MNKLKKLDSGNFEVELDGVVYLIYEEWSGKRGSGSQWFKTWVIEKDAVKSEVFGYGRYSFDGGNFTNIERDIYHPVIQPEMALRYRDELENLFVTIREHAEKIHGASWRQKSNKLVFSCG